MDDRLTGIKLINELDFTFVEVQQQLIADEERWGDTWKERGLVWNNMSQEDRFFETIKHYMNKHRENGEKLPWTKIIGEAHIALVREKKLT
jgi:hypothetical protein